MAGNVSLGFDIFARDLASPQFAKVGAAAQGTSSKVAKASKVMGVALVAAGAVAAKALFETGKTFDQMTDTIVVGTGASGKSLKQLQDVAVAVGKTTPSSFQDVGTAVADLNTRLGLTGKPLQDMASRMLNVSRITGTDLQTNIANISRVFGDWGISMRQQPAAMDAIFKASQATGISIDKLTQQVVQFGAPMRQFGFTFEESAALMGKWEKEGVNANVVLAGLKIGLGNFADAGKEPAKALQTVTRRINEAGSAGEANRIAIEAFGKRAGPDMAAAVREGRFELGDLVKQLKNADGTIEDADKRTRDFKESWQLLKNRGMAEIRPVAEALFRTLSDGMEWLADEGIPIFKRDLLPILQTVGKAFTTVGRFVIDNRKALLALVVAYGTLMTITKIHTTYLAIQAVGGLTKYLLSTKIVTAATKAWTAVQWLLNTALTANPIGLVIAGIAALGVALVIAWKKSDTFRKIVTTAFEGVKKAGAATWDALKRFWDGLTSFAGWIKEKFIAVFRLYGTSMLTVGGIVIKAWTFMVDKILAGAHKVLSVMAKMDEAVGGRIPGNFAKARDAVGKFRQNFNSNTDRVVRDVDRMKDRINGIPKKVETVPQFSDRIAKAKVRDYVQFSNQKLRDIRDQEVEISLRSRHESLIRRFSHGTAGFASGGRVIGPGSGTSDSIPARLSNNEHVWTAREVKSAGGHEVVEMLRTMAVRGELSKGGDIAAFANGGRVIIRPEVAGSSAGAIGRAETRIERFTDQISRLATRYVRDLLTKSPARGALGPNGRLTIAQIARGQDFAKAQVGKPYLWGGVGPAGYDCSGIQSAVLNAALGMHPYQRRGTTGTMPWPGFSRGAGTYSIGWFTGNPGHMSGQLGGLGVESAGGVGVRTGNRARGVQTFPRVAHYDQGGYLPPGWTMAYNGTGRPEKVSTGNEPPIELHLYIDGREVHTSLRRLKRKQGGAPLGLD